MASFNRVILLGNITRDIELRRTGQGTAVTDIGLAVNERVKRNDEWVDEVNFFDVTLWGRTAEIADEYLGKGSSVMIEGRLKHETWEQPDGQKRSKVKVIGERMQMLGSKPSGSNMKSSPSQQGQPATQGSAAQETASAAQGPPPNDEVPF
jgi:single-strand DNA-binding protein